MQPLSQGLKKPLVYFSGLSTQECLKQMYTHQNGLTPHQVNERQLEFGPNVLKAEVHLHIVLQFLSTFKNPLVLILLIVSIVTFVTGSHVDASLILAMVLMSSILNFVQEYKANKSAEKLKNKITSMSLAIRGGKEIKVKSSTLYPGDIIRLNAGDLLPADCRILQAKDFFVNQSGLTGESFPVEKHADPITEKVEDINLSNIAYCGTNVVTGEALAVVLKTGEHTEFGKIALKLAARETPNEFTRGVNGFSLLILRVVIFFVLFIFFVNALLHKDVVSSLAFSVAVAVGLTPEFLPMIMSVTMAKGSVKMAKKGVIVKKLTAIPAFGSMNVLCTDKTGTLTQDKIQVVKYTDFFGNHSERVFHMCYLNSVYQTGITNPMDEAVINYKKSSVEGYKKVDEIPFDFDRKKMSVVVEKNDEKFLITKGAPEEIFKVCKSFDSRGVQKPLDDISANKLVEQYLALSNEGYRVLAVAQKVVTHHKKVYTKEDEVDLELVGFVSFLDPPKSTAKDAIEELEKLNIELKVVTGDNELVAKKICKDVGITIKGVLLGSELLGITDQALNHLVENTTIFARFSPDQKSRVIRALHANGKVVGYMGDGINDALSIKEADVGISVDNAVDVAKESADFILTTKSLHLLKDGVIEGRKTFGNTMKYIMMGISSNFGNMFSVLGAVLFLPYLPMLPMQILLNNFLYDVSQLTIPTDNVDEDFVRKPKRWNIRFIRNFMFVFGPISSLFDFLTFFVLFILFKSSGPVFQTGWFIESLATQTLVIHIIRTNRIPFIQSRPSKYLAIATMLVVTTGWVLPYTVIGQYFGFVSLSAPILLSLASLVILYLMCVEAGKRLFFGRFSSWWN